jgi:integrase
MVVARMLRERAVAAGLDGTRITAHSLRAGHATSAAMAGVPLSRIAAQTRHKTLGSWSATISGPWNLEMASSKDLGL